MLPGIDRAIERMKKISMTYGKIIAYSKNSHLPIIDLAHTPYFEEVLENFGPCLPISQVTANLKNIFDVAFHTKSQSLIIANKGVTIVALSPFTNVNYITRHIACSVYHPNLGVESVNIGLVGNVYDNTVILRAESACPPAFLFGSQRCNCCYQWASIRELAAHFNPIITPQGLSGADFEKWVDGQFTYHNGKHIPKQNGQGMVLIHLDSQAGMGSGYSNGEFSFDLYSRALMRQLGENTTEQIYHTSIKEGYEALGLFPDARKQCNQAGYRLPAIVSEWLGINRNVVALSNNTFKLQQLKAHGFQVQRVKSLGKIDSAGKREAQQRGEDFDHLDMDGEELSFDQEIERLKIELVHL